MHNYKSIAPWRGCPDIIFGYYNDYADPDLLYKSYVFNYWDIESALWENFTEEFPNSTDDAFSAYVRDVAPTYLDELARQVRNQGVIVQTKKGKLWTMNSNCML